MVEPRGEGLLSVREFFRNLFSRKQEVKSPTNNEILWEKLTQDWGFANETAGLEAWVKSVNVLSVDNNYFTVSSAGKGDNASEAKLMVVGLYYDQRSPHPARVGQVTIFTSGPDGEKTNVLPSGKAWLAFVPPKLSSAPRSGESGGVLGIRYEAGPKTVRGIDNLGNRVTIEDRSKGSVQVSNLGSLRAEAFATQLTEWGVRPGEKQLKKWLEHNRIVWIDSNRIEVEGKDGKMIFSGFEERAGEVRVGTFTLIESPGTRQEHKTIKQGFTLFAAALEKDQIADESIFGFGVLDSTNRYFYGLNDDGKVRIIVPDPRQPYAR